MQNLIDSNICQYAGDTTCYKHFRSSEMNQYVTKLETIMSDMLNYAKSKNMIFNLDKNQFNVICNKKNV